MTIKPQTLIILLLVLAMGVAVFATLQPDPPTPEVAVRNLIDDGRQALEEGDSGGVMDLVSESFRGRIGSSDELDRDTLGRYLTIQVLRRGGLEVTVVSQEIEITSDREAVVTMAVVGTRGGLGGALEGNADTMGVELRLTLEGDEWKVVEARERPIADSVL